MSFIINNSKNNDSSVDKSLGNRLSEILSSATRFDILVGYFQFSGFAALEKALRENPNVKLRILVGMNAECFAGRIVEVFRSVEEENDKLSPEQRSQALRERFARDLEAVRKSEKAGTQDFKRRYELYIDLLAQGRLEIRKTFDENHAKLYLFACDDPALQETWITGSSNFSAQGFRNRAEMNVELFGLGVDEARKYFEDLWKNSVPVTDLVPMNNENLLTPFEVYSLLLEYYQRSRCDYNSAKSIRDYFDEPKLENGERKYKPFQYQIDAIEQARAIVENQGGVIIGDVVGLGKSVIATVLAKSLGGKGIVIAPPGLCGNRADGSGWCGYLEDWSLFDRGWEVKSLGKLEDAVKIVNAAEKNGNPFSIVIVDEAHRFRNENVDFHLNLWNICQNKKVILLSATPINNNPREPIALVKLFKKDCRALELKISELDKIYKDLNLFIKKLPSKDFVPAKLLPSKYEKLKEYAQIGDDFDKAKIPEYLAHLRERLEELSREVRRLLMPVMIRRNRLDLQNDPVYSKEVAGLITIPKPPERQLFELSREQSAFYDEIISEYFEPENSKFIGAIYFPYRYTIEGSKLNDESNDSEYWSQKNMVSFTRRFLVKRFESSFAAFNKTLQSVERSCRDVLQILEDKKVVPVSGKARRGALANDDDDAANFDYNADDYYSLDQFEAEKLEEFKRDCNHDIEILQEIQRKFEALQLLESDPKLEKLCDVLEKILAGTQIPPVDGDKYQKRKILVFSEFADTVTHVEKGLRERINERWRERILKVENLSRSTEKTIRLNFDGSVDESAQKDDFDVIIATDKISEGFNLSRAGIVINYDIPWNPVRVIQRMGRINRISRKIFQDLYTYNFFPTERGNDIVALEAIAQNKIALINHAIGEDSQIFSPNENPVPAEMFSKFERVYEDEDGDIQCSFYTFVRKEIERIQMENPQTFDKIAKIVEDNERSRENPLDCGNENYETALSLANSRSKSAGTPRTIVVAKNKGVFKVASLEKLETHEKDGKEEINDEQTGLIFENIEEIIDIFNVPAHTAREPFPENSELCENYWQQKAFLKKAIQKDQDDGKRPKNPPQSYEEQARLILNRWLELIQSTEIEKSPHANFIKEKGLKYIQYLQNDLLQFCCRPTYFWKQEIVERDKRCGNDILKICNGIFAIYEKFGAPRAIDDKQDFKVLVNILLTK